MLAESIYNRSNQKGLRRKLRRDQTEAEKNLWYRLRAKRLGGVKFFRQYSVGSYILDFYCPQHRLAIELDGGQHAEPTNIVHDRDRDACLRSEDIKVLRFWNNDVMENIDAVVQKIVDEIMQENNSLEG